MSAWPLALTATNQQREASHNPGGRGLTRLIRMLSRGQMTENGS